MTRARIDIGPPRATTEHMPFPGHRTLLQVRQDAEKYRHKLGPEMSMKQRRRDAEQGSAKLKRAIGRVA